MKRLAWSRQRDLNLDFASAFLDLLPGWGFAPGDALTVRSHQFDPQFATSRYSQGSILCPSSADSLAQAP
ncbi:hypothetical protein HBI25_027310 [Parastagonospora nodorum]|nr:hypothetical protein HBH52_043970 [Parastagonospora nodorum]KAH4071380.1 hypothetical protein HBH50_079960 [Parastagonospora nodorum]KAH4094075.1 hypothetical protein HBH48_068210 [Parastagonospora nodorum]KAH4417012.1 hypothetical protein HBH92_061370 [Parastagonospora nodorum]KAH4432450.1 hypothetical protein HBH93_134260 [Parastagonospora nodorum]